MRFKITHSGFATLTVSKMKKGDAIYAEKNHMIASSPTGKDTLVRTLFVDGQEAFTPEKRVTPLGKIFAQSKASVKQTHARQRVGERTYVLFQAKADDQKITFRTSFPGTILKWRVDPLEKGEKYLYPEYVGYSVDNRSVNNEDDENRPHGNFIATAGSFLAAQTSVKTREFHTGQVEIARFSETGDSFQKFTGHGYVFMEVHGDLQEIPLYPGESVEVWPGHLLGFTASVALEMVSAGDLTLRNEENNDYVIRLTANGKGGYVYVHGVRDKDFYRRCKEGAK